MGDIESRWGIFRFPEVCLEGGGIIWFSAGWPKTRPVAAAAMAVPDAMSYRIKFPGQQERPTGTMEDDARLGEGPSWRTQYTPQEARFSAGVEAGYTKLVAARGMLVGALFTSGALRYRTGGGRGVRLGLTLGTVCILQAGFF